MCIVCIPFALREQSCCGCWYKTTPPAVSLVQRHHAQSSSARPESPHPDSAPQPCVLRQTYCDPLTTPSTALAKYSTFPVFNPAILIRPFFVI